MSDKQYCVYILTNVNHTVLYTGVTNDLQRRMLEHRSGKGGSFTITPIAPIPTATATP